MKIQTRFRIRKAFNLALLVVITWTSGAIAGVAVAARYHDALGAILWTVDREIQQLADADPAAQ